MYYDILGKKVPGVAKERKAMLVARGKAKKARRALRWFGRLFRGRRGRARRAKQKQIYKQRMREYRLRKQEYEAAKARQHEYEYGYDHYPQYADYPIAPAYEYEW
jgi:Sec-independent protein translocase protein TatA